MLTTCRSLTGHLHGEFSVSFQTWLWLWLWLNAAGPSEAALCEGTWASLSPYQLDKGTWTSLSPDQLDEGTWTPLSPDQVDVRSCEGGWLGPNQPLFTVLAGKASPGSGPRLDRVVLLLGGWQEPQGIGFICSSRGDTV